jgi:putative transcriptional regulator
MKESQTDIFKIRSNDVTPSPGRVLISEPFLCDNIFGRSVVLVVDHNDEGTMGLVMNKRLTLTLNTLISDFKYLDNIPLYQGGPVGHDTLFYIHSLENVRGSYSIGDGLYLNGDFECIKRYILDGGDYLHTMRFFLGYSCWDSMQLMNEIAENTWIVGKEDVSVMMNTDSRQLWKEVMSRQGGKYAVWARFPQIPLMN